MDSELLIDSNVLDYLDNKTQEINLLLEKFNVRKTSGPHERISIDRLLSFLCVDYFPETTAISEIFLSQQYPIIPQAIIDAFHGVVSEAPLNIMKIFAERFLKLLKNEGWMRPLKAFCQRQYGLKKESDLFLIEIKDFSFSSIVYRLNFQIGHDNKKNICFFLKKISRLQASNELLYFNLQKKLLTIAKFSHIPTVLLNKDSQDALLLSPIIPGIESDTILSILMQTEEYISNNSDKIYIRKAIEVLIEGFFSHAALGDVLARNDRNFMNTFIAPVFEGVTQNNILNQLSNNEQVLSFSRFIAEKGNQSISLIGFDFTWLLDAVNVDWIFADISFGVSEINLLSLLAEFDVDSESNISSYEKRRKMILHYYQVYYNKLKSFINSSEVIISELKRSYSGSESQEKLKSFQEILKLIGDGKEFSIKIFRRYLVDYRIRKLYKVTLVSLYKQIIKSNDVDYMEAIEKSELLKYIPEQSIADTAYPSIMLELECFRGVLSNNDIAVLDKDKRKKISWESVIARIDALSELVDFKVCEELQVKKQFIINDATCLMEEIVNI